MNIGIFTNNYRPRLSGVAISIDTFSQEFRKLGHKVFIFAPSCPGHTETTGGVFRLSSIPAIYDKTLALPIPYSGKISREVLDLELDIIHSQHPFVMGQFAARLARRYKIPLVFTYHTLYEEYAHYIPFNEKIVRKMAIILSTSYANKCDLVITPSEGIKNLLRTRGVKAWVERIPTGIDLSKFNGIDPKTIRKSYNISNKTRILLYVGRLAKEKNLVFLIEAFKLVLKKVLDARLIMVGDGPLKKRLKNLAERLQIEKNIIFAGSLPQKEVYVHHLAADLFVFTSLTETQGLVLYEALASGTPVVTIEAVGTSEIITNGINGYLIREQVDEFSECVCDLLLNDRKRRRMSSAAKETAKGFSSTIQAQKMLSLYQELLNRKTKSINSSNHKVMVHG
ncbi:TPA: glycosyltransferase family 4 protein [bacterium]|nr:glycosyltransferase family 4 protein [bacterium]